MHLNKINLFFIGFVSAILVSTFLVSSAFADDLTPAEKARARQYVGGADESDLKVQAQVVKLQKSKNETTIDEEAEEGF